MLWRCVNLSCKSPDDGVAGEFDEIFQKYLNEINQGQVERKRYGHAFYTSHNIEGDTAPCDRCGTRSAVRLCPNCHNTLPRSVDKVSSCHVAVIGAPHVGKSHFIATLIKLFQKDAFARTYFDFNVMDADDSTTSRFREEFFNPIFVQSKRLDKSQQFDRKPLIFRLKKQNSSSFLKRLNKKKSIFLVFYDTAGENFDSEEALGLYARYVKHSSAIILLVDPLQIPSVRSKVEAAGIKNLPTLAPTSEPAHIVSRVVRQYEAFGILKAGGKISTPLAVVFTKADILRDANILPPGSSIYSGQKHQGVFNKDVAKAIHDEVQALIAGWQGGELDSLLNNYFKTYSYFSMSALGQSPDASGNLTNVSPFRTEDSFLWALNQINFL